MIERLKRRWALRKFQKKWRSLNPHNRTLAGCIFDENKVSVGNYTYGGLHVKDFYYDNEKLEIGHFCSIANNVKFFLAGDHFMERPMTFPVKGFLTGQVGGDGYSKGPILVGSDVWFGSEAYILSGVRIGQGAVVGARSVVAKDVPPYAVVVGNPIRIIGYRFSEEIISELMKIDFSKLTKKLCSEYIDILTQPCSLNRIKVFTSSM